MNRIKVEVYLPAIMKSFDVQLPADLQLSKAIPLLAQALSQLSGTSYVPDATPLLCERDSGGILNINMTAWNLGLRNGSRLMLI